MRYTFLLVVFLVFAGKLHSQTANDFLITYKPNAVTKVDLGVSYMLPTESFEIVKNSGNSKYNLTWVYLSLTFRPQLLGLNFK